MIMTTATTIETATEAAKTTTHTQLNHPFIALNKVYECTFQAVTMYSISVWI